MKSAWDIQNLDIDRRKRRILQRVNFSLRIGEVCAVIGANGAGKSSLVQCFTGEQKLLHGNILCEGQSWFALSSVERAKKLAVLPQQSSLNFPFTVQQLAHLGRTPHNSGTQQDRHIVEQALELLDLTHLAQRVYTELSGGEKQRAQLARVIAQIWPIKNENNEAKLLILDEPSSALDIAHKQILLDAVYWLSRKGISVLWIEHDLNMVCRFADNILALNQGRVVAQGTPEKCLDPALVKQLYNADVRFIDDPQTGKKVMSL